MRKVRALDVLKPFYSFKNITLLMIKRKIPGKLGVRNARKMSKWEKRRVSRHYGRKTNGKKALVQVLTMSKKGINGKNIVLLDGRKEVRIPLWFQNMPLQGVYKVPNGSIITARFLKSVPGYIEEIKLYELKNGHERIIEDAKSQAFFWALPDLGHMYMPKELRGRGLAPKIASRADRHVRSQQDGKNTFSLSEFRLRLFDEILTKVGYKKSRAGNAKVWEYKKSGRVKAKADMNRYHLIEAIDPKTGRKKEYAFPIKEREKN